MKKETKTELDEVIDKARKDSSGSGVGIRARAWAVGAKAIAEAVEELTDSLEKAGNRVLWANWLFVLATVALAIATGVLAYYAASR